MAVSALKTGDANHLFEITSASVDQRRQFMRELVKNAELACSLSGGGQVRVDWQMIGDVPKLRVFDTGIGMYRDELINRVACFGAADRTGKNFGVGAKVSLRHVSPHGAVYITVRDGEAHRLTLRAEDGVFGPVIVNNDADDDVTRHVEKVDLDDPAIPAAIREAGHGTAVILLGKSEDDHSVESLTPDPSLGKRWALLVLQEKFTHFAENVKVQVSSYGYENQDTRPVEGTATFLNRFVEGKNVDDLAKINESGARGKVKLSDSVPATAYWWILPETKKLQSHQRVGGRFSVIIDGEVMTTNNRALQRAGVWNSTKRIHIHVVPDSNVEVSQDPGRSMARIDGELAQDRVDEWAAEFSRRQPAAIKALVKGHRRSGGADWSTKVENLYRGMVSSLMLVRSKTGGLTGTPTGTLGLGRLGPERERAASTGTTRKQGTKPADLAKARERRERRNAAGNGGQLNSVASLRAGNTVRARRMASAEVQAPTVMWVNDSPDNINDGLRESGSMGYYNPVEHQLILNHEFRAVQAMITHWARIERVHPGSRERVISFIHDAFAADLAAAVTGSHVMAHSEREQLAKFVTEEALSFAAYNLRNASTHVARAVGSVFGTEAVQYVEAA